MRYEDFFGVKLQIEEVCGVKIFHFQKKGAPLYISAIVQSGARYDKKLGVAHFAEHMICAGSENFPSKDKLAEYIENAGGNFSLETDSDTIRINVVVADMDDLSVAISTLDEIINKPIFDTKTFENERGSILSEYASKKANQDKFIWDVYRRLFFQKTNVEQSVIGDQNSISSISIEDIILFKKEHFSRDNFSIISCGDVDVKKITEKIEPVLSKLPLSSKIAIEKISRLPIFADKLNDIEIYSQSKQANLIMGIRTKTDNLIDMVCGQICANYLAVGRASLLMKKLRYEKGVVYGVSAFSNVYADRGVFVIQTSCEMAKFSDVKRIIADSLRNLNNDSAFFENLNIFKTRLKKSFTVKLQTSESWVKYNNSLAIMPDSYSVFDYLSVINDINAGKMENYLLKNFSDNPIFTAVCGPEKLDLE
jgi:predicted Zn-dependent peptidase